MMKRLLFVCCLLWLVISSFSVMHEPRVGNVVGKDRQCIFDSLLSHNLRIMRSCFCTDVDSYFCANFSYIRGKLCKAPAQTCVEFPRYFCVVFLTVASQLSGREDWWQENSIMMKMQTVDRNVLQQMEEWYETFGDSITCDDVNKVYLRNMSYFADVPDSLKFDWIDYVQSLDVSIHRKKSKE